MTCPKCRTESVTRQQAMKLMEEGRVLLMPFDGSTPKLVSNSHNQECDSIEIAQEVAEAMINNRDLGLAAGNTMGQKLGWKACQLPGHLGDIYRFIQ